MVSQATDPKVSRAKFDREIREFNALAVDYRRKGWFLLEAEFPRVLVLLAAPHLKPPAVVTGVAFDYTDYDLRPPSVRMVDPFTGEPYKASALPISLIRGIQNQVIPVAGVDLPPGMDLPQLVQLQPLMQSYDPEEIPFLCLAGVREYHDHPGHSGDAWELHRPNGEGRLVRLLDVIDNYGLRALTGYRLEVQAKIVGFSANVPQ